MARALYPPVAVRSNVVLGCTAGRRAVLSPRRSRTMTFPRELERVARLIEARVDELLRPEPAPSGLARLSEAMRYAVLGGGKRLRPFLLIEAARLFDVAEEAALDAGVALEC